MAAKSKIVRHMSPEAVAASKANLVKARAHRTHHKGSQTPAQLAAQRANLVKARAHRRHKGTYHLRKHTHKGAHVHHHRKSGAHQASRLGHGLRGNHKHAPLPLGTFKLRASMHSKLTVRKPTGTIPKFKKQLASTGYARHSSWGRARHHHPKMHLRMRHKRNLRVSHWRTRRNRITPR